jgi:hypothetical protein
MSSAQPDTAPETPAARTRARMRRLILSEPASSPPSSESAAEEALDEPEDEPAEQIAEMTGYEPEEREIVRDHLAAAARDHGLDGALHAALPTIAEDLDKPAADVAAELATAQALVERHQRFKSERGITDQPAPTRRAAAREAYEAVTRRSERIKDALAHWPRNHDARGRRRKEAQLEQLEALEDQHWAVLHPGLIGSPFGGPALEGDADPGEERHYCACGAETTRRQLYSFSMCATCAHAYEIRTGRRPPRV